MFCAFSEAPLLSHPSKVTVFACKLYPLLKDIGFRLLGLENMSLKLRLIKNKKNPSSYMMYETHIK